MKKKKCFEIYRKKYIDPYIIHDFQNEELKKKFKKEKSIFFNEN